MKKFLKRIAILIIVLIVLAIGGAYIYMNTYFKSDAATYASKLVGTNVGITAVTLNPLQGSVSIRGLSVGNPKGYKSNNAIDLGAIYVNVDLESLLTDKIIVNNVTLNSAEIFYELQNNKDNIRKIMDNVKRNSGSAKGGSSSGSKKDFVIRNLNVTNSSVVLAAQIFNFADDKEIEIPDISMTNVTKANIASKVKQVANRLLKDVAKVAVQEQVNKQINKATDKVKEKINEKINDKLGDAIGGKLKSLF